MGVFRRVKSRKEKGFIHSSATALKPQKCLYDYSPKTLLGVMRMKFRIAYTIYHDVEAKDEKEAREKAWKLRRQMAISPDSTVWILAKSKNLLAAIKSHAP